MVVFLVFGMIFLVVGSLFVTSPQTLQRFDLWARRSLVGMDEWTFAHRIVAAFISFGVAGLMFYFALWKRVTP